MAGLNQQEREVIKCDSAYLKIRNFKVQNFNELAIKIIEWSKFLGLREPHDKKELGLLLAFLKNQYGDFTMPEISLAFELAMTQQLNIDNINHYQSFSAMYLSMILNSYREFRSDIRMKKIALEQKQKELNEIKSRPSIEEREKQNYEGLLKYINDKKQLPIAWDYEGCYNHMERIGIINLTDGQKAEYKNKIEERIKSEAKLVAMEEGNKAMQNILSVLHNPTNLKIRCRIEYVKEYFKKMY